MRYSHPTNERRHRANGVCKWQGHKGLHFANADLSTDFIEKSSPGTGEDYR